MSIGKHSKIVSIIGAAWASTVSYKVSFLSVLFLCCRFSGKLLDQDSPSPAGRLGAILSDCASSGAVSAREATGVLR